MPDAEKRKRRDSEAPSAAKLRFKQELKRVGLTQVVLEARTGVPQSSISRFPGGRSLQRDNLIALLSECAAAGVDLTYVFSGVRITAETPELARQIAAELLPKLLLQIGRAPGDKPRQP